MYRIDIRKVSEQDYKSSFIPDKHRMVPRAQAATPGSDSVLVLTIVLQWGQVTVAGDGPYD